jgi:glutaredoxin
MLQDPNTIPTLFNDGCNVCLDIAATLGATMPGLRVIDLGIDSDAAFEAIERGVRALPCLVIGAQVLPIAPHSDIADIGQHA